MSGLLATTNSRESIHVFLRLNLCAGMTAASSLPIATYCLPTCLPACLYLPVFAFGLPACVSESFSHISYWFSGSTVRPFGILINREERWFVFLYVSVVKSFITLPVQDMMGRVIYLFSISTVWPLAILTGKPDGSFFYMSVLLEVTLLSRCRIWWGGLSISQCPSGSWNANIPLCSLE